MVMKISMTALLLTTMITLIDGANADSSCPISSDRNSSTVPLYLLTLVPFPDPKDGTRWDEALATVSGARVARDEINKRSDLLPGYHIELIVDSVETCSHAGADTGLNNLVKHTVDPPCRPVVAVNGLVCSSHTSILSPVAGHAGYDLIQLTVANSPIFRTHHDRFPHLWQFLGSATVYSDTIVALMNQFNWNRIGIVFDSENVFYTENARYLKQSLNSHNKTVVLKSGIRGTFDAYFDSVISGIKSSEVTVMAVMLNEEQSSLLLERVLQEGMIFPHYTWIHVETIMDYLLDENLINDNDLYNATRGHILLHTLTRMEDSSTKLVSGRSYEEFEAKYLTDLEIVREIYNSSDLASGFIFGSNVYDQVWALAIAMNRSLPILADKNLSIENYEIGDKEITEIIENQLKELSFQGAGGLVKFNEYRSVSAPVEIFQIMENRTEKRVGIYNPLNLTDFHIDIDASQAPGDTLPPKYLLIPLPLAVTLFSLNISLVVFTTVQLALYLYYRKHQTIKATSPHLSLLMFAGCYLLYIASALKITYSTFPIDRDIFIKLVSSNIIIVLNGISLILITLFIKLLRVYRIFSSRLKADLGSYWRNNPLLLIIIFLTAFPNITVIPTILLNPPTYDITRVSKITYAEVHIELTSASYFITGGIIACYIAVFSSIILYLAISTRKIKHKNFKDTKKLNFFIYSLLFTLSFISPLYIVLLVKGNEPAANIVLVAGMMVISAACQIILFLPKVLPTVLSSVYPTWEKTLLYSRRFSLFTNPNFKI